jgi:hypothetical protein
MMSKEKTTLLGKCLDCAQGILEPVHHPFALYVDDDGTEQHWYCTYCGSNNVELTDDEHNKVVEQGPLYRDPNEGDTK